MQRTSLLRRVTAFWRDERVLNGLWQVVVLVLVVAGAYYLYTNMVANLRSQGTALGFSFLQQVAGFDIAEKMLEYSRSSPYLRAFQVGLLNTLLVSLLGIAFSTVIGIVVGVARLSSNFIVNRIARVYIEILRNIPLLVLLVFWYRAIFLKLPRIRDVSPLFDAFFLTNRGVGIPWGIPTATFTSYLTILGFGIFAAVVLAGILIWRGRQTERMPLWQVYSLALFLLVGAVGWFILPEAPLALDLPFVKGLNLAGGLILSPEFLALLSGLVIYTSAFIAEVVRAGIQSVSRGQAEAARALGLNGFQTLRMVIFPQAMRVIVPPLTSQYLNLTKNSSLAVAIGYPDVFYVSSTILNQSGRAVEMIAMVMLTYLTLSLLTAVFMNWYNQRIKLVER